MERDCPVVGIASLLVGLQMIERAGFKTFIPSACNERALEICKAAVLSPGSCFNPLLLIGGTGTGKTHLMTAMACEMGLGRDEVLFAESMLYRLHAASKQQKIATYYSSFREQKAFFIDAVNVLIGQNGPDEAIAGVILHLVGSGKKVVVNCHQYLDEIPNTPLKEAISCGTIAKLEQPDFVLRRAVAVSQLGGQELTGAAEFFDHLAMLGSRSLWETQGVVNRLKAWAEARGVSVGPEIVADALGDWCRLKGTKD